MLNPQEQFKEAMRARGIAPPADLQADGNLHRCDVDAPNGEGDASYLLHPDGIPAGGFTNWHDGQDWQNWRYQGDRSLSPDEEKEWQAKIQLAKARYQEERLQRQEEARKRAQTLWEQASPCEEHPYLTTKGIAACGARMHGESLLIPLMDASGEIHSLQFIKPDGSKRFLSGGRVQGCYFLLGNATARIYVAEGFATATSIYAANGQAVAVAFNATNLAAVAQALRESHPGEDITICGDDDYRTPNNPGKTLAFAAARLVKGKVAFPDFGNERPEGATDFNDLHRALGIEAVRGCLDNAQPVLDGSFDAPATGPGCTDEDSQITDREKGLLGVCSHGSGRFELRGDGVFYIGCDNHGNEKPALWICAPLYVKAKTRDTQSGEWGRLLEWHDEDEVKHQWAMPLEMLHGDGADVRKELARQGLSISVNKAARELLAAYINVWPTQQRARCVDTLGWHERQYVLPGGSIGASEEIAVFQNRHALDPALSVSGTAEEWRDAIGKLAKGNSRLMFAMSAAFAGALVGLIGEDSGGFHLCGASSSGKTTALKIAASVWGHPDTYTRLWRATANGLEGLAALHNDGVLILDELSQIDLKQAGEAAYLLANGQGKARASRNGMARPSAKWRLLFLSSGEETLGGIMAKAGKRANAGQEIRLVDIDADAGKGMGLFEELHGHASAADLSVALKGAVSKFHGAVGIAWLERLVADQQEVKEVAADAINAFVERVVPTDASGQIVRVARRFGLVQYAGEVATQFGLTGWELGEASDAAQQCFNDWVAAFGCTGSREERNILDQVRAFFELHGASRFQSLVSDTDQKIINRAGFIRFTPTGMQEFLVLPEVFRNEICSGFRPKLVIEVLLKHGWIEPGGDGRPTQKPRIQGLGAPRIYVFKPCMWAEDENEKHLAA